MRRHCFFHVFQGTSYKVRKKCEKTAFFEIFARRPTKSVRKQCFYTFFKALCTNFTKKRHNIVFWPFCTTSHEKCQKTVFFHVFRDIFYKVRKKCGKTCFFFLAFCKTSHKKKMRWQYFFTFFEALCTKFAKNEKNSVFWAFCTMSCKEC